MSEATFSAEDRTISRGFALSLFLLVGIANAEFLNFYKSIETSGLFDAFMRTFDVSVIQIFGLYLSLRFLKDSMLPPFSTLDIVVLGFAGLLFIAPVSGLAWTALTLVPTYVLIFGRADDYGRRGMVLMMAVAYTSLWSKLIFKYFLDYILVFDTAIISTLTGTSRYGNLIFAADGRTTLEVLEGCSSFSNISIAVLAWIIARTYYGTHGVRRGLVFICISAAAVVAINTARIAVIALDPRLYELAHGTVGATIANFATTIAVTYISLVGARR